MTPVEQVKSAARGQWLSILAEVGLPQECLTGKNCPCPKCGGTDRFAAFSDVAETGGVNCRKCHNKKNGDGIATVQWWHNCTFHESLDFIAKQVGLDRAQQNGKPTDKTYQTAEAAIAILERKHGKRSAVWTYHDASGEPVGVIVRWDKVGGKDIRPVARRGDQWTIGGMPEPRPLYGLPDLAGAQRVYIVEGEKAADVARSIGLTATTSAHGSQSPDKTDWSPLAGTECVILPDHDEPGGKYADTVAAILAKLTPPAVVKVVELPGLPDHGDIADWIDAHGDAAEPDEVRRQVEALADEAEVIQPNLPAARIERFQPFPTDALPELIRGFVEASAKAIGCDPSYVAVPLLCGLTGAVGATRRIDLSPTWRESCILWGAIVGESGTQKTPAQDMALRALEDLQSWQLDQLPDLQRDYERNKSLYESDKKNWHSKGRKKGEPPPEPPQEPSVPRYIVGDSTIEAMAELLNQNQRGLVVVNDELSAWLGGMGRYKSGQARGEVGQWLSTHCAGRLLVDRKTGTKKTIFVRRAAVSIVGGITPGAFRLAIGGDHMDDGLAARLLVVMPPRRPKRWNDAEVPQSIEKRIGRLYARLLVLDFTTDADGVDSPIDLPLEPNALAVFQRFVDEHGVEQLQHEGHLASVWSKLEAAAPRLALLFALCRWADGEAPTEHQEPVTVEEILAGITLASWFGNEWRRIYATIYETNDDHDLRRLIEWIQRKGGSVTAREVQQGHRQYLTAQEAEAALEELAKAGHGRWESTSPGGRGRPTRRFVLSSASTVYGNSRNPEENGNTVDVDSVDAPETQPEDDGFGEV